MSTPPPVNRPNAFFMPITSAPEERADSRSSQSPVQETSKLINELVKNLEKYRTMTDQEGNPVDASFQISGLFEQFCNNLTKNPRTFSNNDQDRLLEIFATYTRIEGSKSKPVIKLSSYARISIDASYRTYSELQRSSTGLSVHSTSSSRQGSGLASRLSLAKDSVANFFRSFNCASRNSPEWDSEEALIRGDFRSTKRV